MFWLAAIAAAAAPSPTVDTIQMRCDAGELEACQDVGLQLLEPDPVRAAGVLERACEGQLARACVTLGLLLADSRALPIDTARATELLEEQCASGEPAGCRGLGLLLRDGRPPADDAHRGAVLLEQACDRGDFPACVVVGDIALSLSPGPVGEYWVEAIRHYAMACSGGLRLGCSKVAALGFRSADGVNAEAYGTLRDNCGAGEPWSCAFLEERGLAP